MLYAPGIVPPPPPPAPALTPPSLSCVQPACGAAAVTGSPASICLQFPNAQGSAWHGEGRSQVYWWLGICCSGMALLASPAHVQVTRRWRVRIQRGWTSGLPCCAPGDVTSGLSPPALFDPRLDPPPPSPLQAISNPRLQSGIWNNPITCRRGHFLSFLSSFGRRHLGLGLNLDLNLNFNLRTHHDHDHARRRLYCRPNAPAPARPSLIELVSDATAGTAGALWR